MNTETAIDVEASAPQTQALAIRPEQPVTLFGSSEPVAIIEKASNVATALKGVLKAQKLISNIQGKEYPRCEAWTLLGTMLGVFPVLCWTKPTADGWEARVEARTRDGSVVGAAEAECLRSEKSWTNRDDFAVRSMAQTRATAKALRMPLGFVMTLAGYEATPAEEMAHENGAPPVRNSNTRNYRIDQPQPQPKPEEKPAQTVKNSNPVPTEKHRDKMIENLLSHFDQRDILDYARKTAILLPTETIPDWPLRYVPATKEQWNLLEAAMQDFVDGQDAVKPFINPEPPAEKPAETRKSRGMSM